MIALDVNVLVYAMRSDRPEHRSVYDWLESVRVDRQPVALFPPVLVGLIRIATNPRIFLNPSLPGTVTNFARALQATPGFEVLPTTERVLARTLALCEQTQVERQSRARRLFRSARHGISLHLDHDRPRLLP